MDAGPAPHPTHVVALHDCASSAAQWRPIAALADAHWQWHTPDLPGRPLPGAASDAPQLSLEAQRVLNQLPLSTDDCFHLVGHGYGAAVAIQLALQRPRRVRSLVLYEPLVMGVDSAATNDCRFSRWPTSTARALAAFLHGRDVWPDWDDDERARWSGQADVAQRQLCTSCAVHWSAALLSTLPLPVTLLYGDRTRACIAAVSETLARMFPKAALRLLRGADHMTPITQPSLVAGAILQTLDPGMPRLAIPRPASLAAA